MLPVSSTTLPQQPSHSHPQQQQQPQQQVSLQSIIQSFHAYLREFLAHSILLLKTTSTQHNNNHSQTPLLIEEPALKQLSHFLDVSEHALKRYDQLPIDQRMQFFYEQKEWLSIVEQLKRIQLSQHTHFAEKLQQNNGSIDMQLYAEFVQTIKSNAFTIQRDNLIKKLKLNVKPALRQKRVLPPVPDFEDENHNENLIDFDNLIFVKCENEDTMSYSSDSASTAAGVNNNENSKAGFKLIQINSNSSCTASTPIKVFASVSGQVTQPNATSSAVAGSLFMPHQIPEIAPSMNLKYLEKVHSKLQEELLRIIELLNLSTEASSTVFKCSQQIIAFLSNTSKAFFKSKPSSLIAAAILLHASACVGYPITIMALVRHVAEKERCLSKVHQKLMLELRQFKQVFNAVEPEALIQTIARALNVENKQTLAASSYLYSNMSVKGFVKGTRVDLLAAAIVFLSATLNGTPVDTTTLHQKLGFEVNAISRTIAFILEHRQILINNEALFSIQNML